MFALNHQKKTLLLCAALSLTACQNNKEPMINKAPVMNVDKIITYNTPGKTDADHLYLEEVLGEKALGDVNNWNTQTLDRLMADPLFEQMNSEVLEIVNSKDKIPYVSLRGGEVHNFWQDEKHERGVWRKSSLTSYLSDSPVWETVLDFDELSKNENKNWVYKGNNCLGPDYELCIVSLSDGGKDAVVNREFDTKTKSFVEDGFITKESKSSMDWIDKDTTIIGVDFGENTMTNSGYPMVSKIWKRGTP